MSRCPRTSFPLLLILLMGLSLLSSPASAVRVDNLYRVELPVADQSTAERLKRFSEAMKQVLVKLTGDPGVADLPQLQGAIQSAARFVQEYRYSSRPVPAAGKGEEAREQLFLSVHFDAKALDRLLRENRLRLWGRERPGTLLLMAVQQGGRLRLVADDTTPQLVAQINRGANAHGLPLLLPLNDLEDSRVLDARKVRDRDDTAIAAISARYAPDAVLIGTLAGNDKKGWRGDWQLRFSGRRNNWSNRGESREAVLDQMLDRLARSLASEYAFGSSMSGGQDLLLTVEDVATLDDLLRVSRYLKSLEAIESLRPRLVEPNRVSFRVRLRNASQDLSRLIALGDVLEQEELPQVQAGASDALVRLRYRLLR